MSQAAIDIPIDYIQTQAQRELQSVDIIANTPVFDDFSLAISYTKVGDDYTNISIHETTYSRNIFKYINDRYPEANITIEDFNTPDDLKNAKDILKQLMDDFKRERRAWYESRGIKWTTDDLIKDWAFFLNEIGRGRVIWK